MAFVAPLLTALLTAINITIALRTIWRERRDRRTPPAHPLAASLDNIAMAIRDLVKEWK